MSIVPKRTSKNRQHADRVTTLFVAFVFNGQAGGGGTIWACESSLPGIGKPDLHSLPKSLSLMTAWSLQPKEDGRSRKLKASIPVVWNAG